MNIEDDGDTCRDDDGCAARRKQNLRFVKCFNCNKKDHTTRGQMDTGVTFNQERVYIIPIIWILLDNWSTICTLSNGDMLE